MGKVSFNRVVTLFKYHFCISRGSFWIILITCFDLLLFSLKLLVTKLSDEVKLKDQVSRFVALLISFYGFFFLYSFWILGTGSYIAANV